MSAQTWLDLLLGEAPEAAFEEHERTLAAAVGAQDAAREGAAARRIRALLEQRTQRARELATLNEVAAHLTATGERGLSQLLDDIVVHARRVLAVDMAYLGLVEEDQRLTVHAVTGALTPQLRGLRLPADSGLASEVLRRVEPVWTYDYANAPFTHQPIHDRVAAAEQIEALLGVPLLGREKVLGVLFVLERRARRFTGEDIDLLVALAAHAAIAVHNQQLVDRLATTNATLRQRTEELERALRWDTILTEVVLRGGDADDLLDEIRALAGRPVDLVLRDGPPSQLPAEVVTAVGELADGDRARTIELDDERFDVRPVAAGRRVFGALVTRQEPTADAGRLLERAAPALALTLVGAEALAEATQRATDSFFADLVNNPSSDPATLARQTRLAGLAANTPYVVLVANRHGERILAPALRRSAPAGSVIADLGSRVAIAIPAHSADEAHDRWSTLLADTTAGMSGPGAGGNQLSRAYHEACQVADALAALDRTGSIATADELGIYRVLLSSTSREALERAIEHELGPLLDEEARRGVPLLATLETYFDHSLRPGETAKALTIHVNTVYQRVDTITRLLGPGWRTEPRRFDLQLLLRLRRAHGRLQAGREGHLGTFR
jgi:GAF domain-containing protein